MKNVLSWSCAAHAVLAALWLPACFGGLMPSLPRAPAAPADETQPTPRSEARPSATRDPWAQRNAEQAAENERGAAEFQRQQAEERAQRKAEADEKRRKKAEEYRRYEESMKPRIVPRPPGQDCVKDVVVYEQVQLSPREWGPPQFLVGVTDQPDSEYASCPRAPRPNAQLTDAWIAATTVYISSKTAYKAPPRPVHYEALGAPVVLGDHMPIRRQVRYGRYFKGCEHWNPRAPQLLCEEPGQRKDGP